VSENTFSINLILLYFYDGPWKCIDIHCGDRRNNDKIKYIYTYFGGHFVLFELSNGRVGVVLVVWIVGDCGRSDGPRRYIYTRPTIAIVAPRCRGGNGVCPSEWMDTRGRASPRGSPGRPVSPSSNGLRHVAPPRHTIILLL